MSDEGRAKEIGQTVEEETQQGPGKILIYALMIIIGIPVSIIFWAVSIILWVSSWIIAWVGFAIMFVFTWIISLSKPAHKEWGYRHIEQEDWFKTKEELQKK